MTFAEIHLEQDGFPDSVCASPTQILQGTFSYYCFSSVLCTQALAIVGVSVNLVSLVFITPYKGFCHLLSDNQGWVRGRLHREGPLGASQQPFYGKKNCFYKFRHYLMAIHVGSSSRSSYPCKLYAFEQLQKINQLTLGSSGLGPKPNSCQFLSGF